MRPVFSWRETADLLREALPVIGAVVLATVYLRCDGVILSLLSNHAEVGVFGLAVTVAFNTVVLATFFQNATLSRATELFSSDVAAFAGFMRHSVELMWFLAAPVAVIGGLLAGPLIGFFGDQAFVGRGTPTLALLCIAAALRFVGSTLSQGLFACHHQRFLLWMSFAELGVIAGLNFALDGRYGAVGAGIALVCMEVSRMLDLQLVVATTVRLPHTGGLLAATADAVGGKCHGGAAAGRRPRGAALYSCICRISGDQLGRRPNQVVDPGRAARTAGDGVSRERDRAYLKPAPGAVLPLPSGRRLAVLIVADENHELLEQCLASVTEHLPELPVYIYAPAAMDIPGVWNWPPATPRRTGFRGR